MREGRACAACRHRSADRASQPARFEKAAAQVLELAGRNGQPAAIMMCDIDHFKSINDTYGHDFGDQSIKHVAKVIAQSLAAHGGIAGRLVARSSLCSCRRAQRLWRSSPAEELRIACALQPVAFDGKSAKITMSVGVAGAMQVESDLGRLIPMHSALYRAKRSGRNRWRPIRWRQLQRPRDLYRAFSCKGVPRTQHPPNHFWRAGVLLVCLVS